MLNIINEFIESKDNRTKRDFCSWKNKNAFLYAEVFSSPEDNYYAISFSFGDDKTNIDEVKAVGLVEYFKHNFFSFEISKEKALSLSEKDCFISSKDIPDWKYIKGNYNELLEAKAIKKEKGLESLILAMQDYLNLEDMKFSEMYSMDIEDIVIEIIYLNVDSNFKWGEITGRIIFKGEVIGHYNRNGRYMEEYEYYTHDIKKWKEMLSVIKDKLNIKKQDFKNLNVFNKDDDIYEIARISDSNDE